jgi:hypothetical protein
MDLLLIARKIWRHKLVTVPVILLTIVGAAYAVAVKQPLYEATSSYLLINPPAAPTADEIARNPALGKIHFDNPYTRFADQSVVIDVLARSMNSDSARTALVKAGADQRFIVEAATRFGATSPIVQITGTGATPQAAIKTAEIVGHGVIGELDRMQATQKVDPKYRITTQQVESPDGPRLQASGQLRMLVGVLVMGVIGLFVVISITDALEMFARERRAARAEDEWTDEDMALLDAEPADGYATNGRGQTSSGYEHYGPLNR